MWRSKENSLMAVKLYYRNKNGSLSLYLYELDEEWEESVEDAAYALEVYLTESGEIYKKPILGVILGGKA